ncbi:MAG: FAD/NAD(P)-binding protein, partial [Planctomycetaceae bacterium]|nr:FAD/NAD(P)-binding protein [Planctomycetaceae bacterium]
MSACQSSNPWLGHSARIDRIVDEAPGVRTYFLELQDAAMRETYRYQPGQFNMLHMPGLGEVAISISGSIHDAADDTKSRGIIPHTIREAGRVTQALADLAEGDHLIIRGPFGSSWPVDRAVGKDLILVAGGIGLAPLRPVVYHVLNRRADFGAVTVLYGARTPSGMLYTNEFAHWREQGIAVKTTVDRADGDWGGNVGVVTLLLDRLKIDSPSETILMTCGPEVMMWYTIQSALKRGLSDQNVYVSLERNMNCAIGLCGHCQFGPQFICKDGPVFPFNRVASIL